MFLVFYYVSRKLLDLYSKRRTRVLMAQTLIALGRALVAAIRINSLVK